LKRALKKVNNNVFIYFVNFVSKLLLWNFSIRFISVYADCDRRPINSDNHVFEVLKRIRLKNQFLEYSYNISVGVLYILLIN